MQYDGYSVGAVLKSLRLERKLSKEEMSRAIGLSVSSIKQYENGGRNLSMGSLYLMMDYFAVDANTILNINHEEADDSIDKRLTCMNSRKRKYFQKTFHSMLDHASQIAL